MSKKFNPFKKKHRPEFTKELIAQVHKAELDHPKPKSGETKKAQVLDWLTDKVDIPLIPKSAEIAMWSLIIGLVVDFLKGQLTEFAKDTFKK